MKMKPDDKYLDSSAPSATTGWIQFWLDQQRTRSKRGEYTRAAKGLEIWGQFVSGGGIQASESVSDWHKLAKQIAGKKFSVGLLALRGEQPDLHHSPGLTIVAESPGGGSMAARIIVDMLSEQGVGGILARQEMDDRWAVVKIVYCPNWYAKFGDETFGVNWGTRNKTNAGEAASKLIWCEHAVQTVDALQRDLPNKILDSLFFDCYASSDALHELSPEALNRLISVGVDNLAETIVGH